MIKQLIRKYKMWRSHNQRDYNLLSRIIEDLVKIEDSLDSTTEICQWCDNDEPEFGVYGTACGHAFNFERGGPKDNGFDHCPFCGGKIA